jgi:hypothetical protein
MQHNQTIIPLNQVWQSNKNNFIELNHSIAEHELRSWTPFMPINYVIIMTLVAFTQKQKYICETVAHISSNPIARRSFVTEASRQNLSIIAFSFAFMQSPAK